jgi:hypothetical protein
MTPRSLRVGDADRLAAADQLAVHTAAGRLTLVEHDERVVAVWAARTRADLDALFTDLPCLVASPMGGRLPTSAPTATVVLIILAVLTAWLAALAHPAWAATMMAGCM